MRLDLYTHHFAVSDLTSFDLPKIYGFLLPLVQKGLIKKRGRFRPVPLRTFAARLKNRSMFRFHINQYFEFTEYMRQQGYQDADFKVHDHRDTKFNAAKVKFKVKNLPKPYERQVPIIDYVLEPGISKMVTLQTGKGKALCNDTVLLTDQGWRRMGDLQVGWRVMCPNGKWTTITAVYPQEGLSKMYRLEWEDGRVSHACQDHQWTVQHAELNSIVTTKDLVSQLKEGPVSIPPIYPMEPGIREFGPVPIWLYAVLMGRATYVLPSHKGLEPRVEISIPDRMLPAFRDRLATTPYTLREGQYGRWRLEEAGSFPTGLIGLLQGTYGISDLISLSGWNLPEDMDQLSLVDRIDFLRYTIGLQPCGGGTGIYRRQGTSNVLTVIQKIIWSIGGRALLKGDTLTYTYPVAHASIHDGWRVKPQNNTGIRLSKITRIEDRPATCITVDDPSAMFVTQDYIATHNTMIAMTCAQRLGMRTIVIVRGGFTAKWHEDLDNAFDFEEGELLLIRGAAGLNNLLKDAIHKRPRMAPSVIIVSTRTLANYFKLYEMSNGKDKKVIVPPHEILPTLRIGFRIMDEVHLEFHFMYRMDLYSHVMKSLSLSATLISRDEFVNKVHEIAYPTATRNDGGGYHAYTNAICMMYRISNPPKSNFMGAQGYSHHLLEEWVLESPTRKKAYLGLIRKQVKEYFVDIHREGQSYLIFASSVEMCDAIKEDLETYYGTYEVDRYCGSMGDDYEETFIKPDIVVSTLGSAGAAVDKPGLLGTLLTIAVDSIQSVLQLMGRTRELKGEFKGMVPTLVYFSCKDIEVHEKYRKNKVELFKGRVLSHRLVECSTVI